ncbi:MAG: DUF4288 domain-containing protein [Bacteroidota bacterium]
MKRKITGLEDWNLTEENIKNLKNKAVIKIHLSYPDYKSIIQFTTAQRRKIIAKTFRDEFNEVKLILKQIPFERLGSSIRPRGIKTELPLNQVWELIQKEFRAHISIVSIEEMEEKEEEVMPCFWSIKARFAIQIENAKGGMQGYEDRIMLICALDQEDAQQKLLKSLESYAKPYLNSSGRLVRWKFEKFLDAYSTDIYSADDFMNDKGVEVYSELGNRKLKPELEWQRNQ